MTVFPNLPFAEPAWPRVTLGTEAQCRETIQTRQKVNSMRSSHVSTGLPVPSENRRPRKAILANRAQKHHTTRREPTTPMTRRARWSPLRLVPYSANELPIQTRSMFQPAATKAFKGPQPQYRHSQMLRIRQEVSLILLRPADPFAICWPQRPIWATTPWSSRL